MNSGYLQLYDIANETGSDKGHVGPSKGWSANNYADIYQAYFGGRRLEIQNVCEIGLGVPGPNWESNIAHGRNPMGGGSLKIWRKFFPNAMLYGLDINPAPHLDGDHVQTFVVDQSSAESLTGFKAQTVHTQFDIIIDDGSHIADHQQLTLSLMWEKLKPGGYYIIEDLNDIGLNRSGSSKHAPISAESTRILFMEFAKTGIMKTPNAFQNEAFLNDIAYLALHTFPNVIEMRDIAREMVRILVGRGGKGMLRHEFLTRAPKMVVLQKMALVPK